jgi:uncharacterized protein (TIGR03435 family)
MMVMRSREVIVSERQTVRVSCGAVMVPRRRLAGFGQLVLFGVAALLPLLGQSRAAPAFEVTSVKRNTIPPNERRNEKSCSGGRFVFRGGNVSTYVTWAYQLTVFPAFGLPEWAASRDYVYDIEAQAEGDVSEDQCRLMLQTLLADRFKLKVHWEARETPVFALVLAKGGPKMQKVATPASFTTRISGGKVQMRTSELTGWSMDLLAQALVAAGLDRPVVNGTGIEGVYKFDLEFRRESASEDVGPDVRTALGKLGLQLEARKELIKRLVVDHVEAPDEN